MDRLIFHVDVNSAFLSWEATKRVELGEPDIREVPAVVGGDPSKRTSIVTAKSIPAKKYGINTGEPISMALRKCPNLVIVKSDFNIYIKYSTLFKKICKEYTPVMESFSIDEVFLDMSGMKNIYPDPIATAYEIKDRIKNELGFTVNVGIGNNKLCAKMASDFTKPDRVHTLFLDEIEQKLWPLPVDDLFTCGKASAYKLGSIGIKTIGDLARTDLSELKQLLGERQGIHLREFANGIDDSPVVEQREEAKGYSAETTFEENLDTISAINHILLAQADVVASRLRAENAKCRCVAVSFRTDEWKNKSHQRKLKISTDVTDEIYDVAKQLMAEFWKGESVRLVGLALSDIDRDGYEQMSFLVDEKNEKLKKLDSALDSIRTRFGNGSIKRASVMDTQGRINRRFNAEAENKRQAGNTDITNI